MNEPKTIALSLPYAQTLRSLPLFFSLLLYICWLGTTPSHGASYTDEHEDGSLSKWTAVGTRTWSEASGAAIPQPDNASPGFLLRQEVVNDSDGTFEVDIHCVATNLTNCKLGGPVFRWTGPNTFFALALNELDSAGMAPGNQLYMLKNSIDFSSAQKIMLADSLPLGGHQRNYPFKITMQDSVFVVYLQDSTHTRWDSVGTWTDASNPSGQVGYGYYAWGENTFFSRSSWNGGLTPVNQAPTAIALSASAVDENVPLGSLIANLSASDPDAGETFSYALVPGTGDADNAAFSIAGNQLRTASAMDFESKQSYTLRLQVTDAGDLSFSQAFTINVNDLDETLPNQAPTAIALSASAVDENVPLGSLIANLSASDPDAGETFSYALVAGSGDADNAVFAITGNELRTASAMDFESKQSYALRIRVTDAGGLSYSQAFTISVNNLDEPLPVPSWAAPSLQVSLLDSASRLLETRTWNREDTLDIDYGSRLRFTLALSSSSSLTVQASSPQTGLEASWTDKGILVRWEALDTGLQTLEFIWNNAYGSDTARLNAYVKRNHPPVLVLQNMGIFHTQTATFVSTQPPVILDSPPERLLFHFLLQDMESDSIRFNIVTDETSIEARRQQDTLVLYWNHPLPSDTLLSLRLEDSQGNSNFWSLAWSYATTEAVRPVDQSGFRMLLDSQGQGEGFYLPRAGRVIISTVNARGALLERQTEFMAAGAHLWAPRGEAHTITRVQWEGHNLLLP